jgi:signal transduction histidine kinase
MAYRRVAVAALMQGLLFACGAGVLLCVRAGYAATATALGLVALWIGAAAAWQARLQPPPSANSAQERRRDDAVRLRLLASLLDQTPAPLVTRDGRGGFRACNRAARQLFRTDGPLLEPPPSLVAAIEQGDPSGRATARVGDGDAARTYAVSLSDILAEEEPLRLAVLLDIEPALRVAEAAALRELMQVLSHEIMNGLTPVASLAGTVQELLLAEDPDAGAMAREALEVLARRAEGLARFAEGYRTLARLPPPVRAPASLSALMDEAGRLFRSRWSREGVTLEVHPPSPDVRVAIDRDQIMHALANLMTNAAQAALAGAAPPRVRLSAGVQPRAASICVADSGGGVPDAILDRIGRPFFTTKPQGTGVGLSLARQVALAHGGALETRPSGVLGGAEFELLLGG